MNSQVFYTKIENIYDNIMRNDIHAANIALNKLANSKKNIKKMS